MRCIKYFSTLLIICGIMVTCTVNATEYKKPISRMELGVSNSVNHFKINDAYQDPNATANYILYDDNKGRAYLADDVPSYTMNTYSLEDGQIRIVTTDYNTNNKNRISLLEISTPSYHTGNGIAVGDSIIKAQEAYSGFQSTMGSIMVPKNPENPGACEEQKAMLLSSAEPNIAKEYYIMAFLFDSDKKITKIVMAHIVSELSGYMQNLGYEFFPELAIQDFVIRNDAHQIGLGDPYDFSSKPLLKVPSYYHTKTQHNMSEYTYQYESIGQGTILEVSNFNHNSTQWGPDGKTYVTGFYLLTPEFETFRGIKVGDDCEKVRKVYKDIEPLEDVEILVPNGSHLGDGFTYYPSIAYGIYSYCNPNTPLEHQGKNIEFAYNENQKIILITIREGHSEIGKNSVLSEAMINQCPFQY